MPEMDRALEDRRLQLIMIKQNCADELSNRAFSGSAYSRIALRESWVEKCVFQDIRFESCDFRALKDHQNTFERCIFEGCKFDSAAFGIRTSRYSHCEFQGCDFRNSVFDNAVFADCKFSNCRLSGTDFSASGFWRCRFSGRVEDVVFRGTYQFARDLDEHTPIDMGLHGVDFSDAELKWIAVSNGCPIMDVVLPESGAALIVRRDRMLTDCLAEIRNRFAGNRRQAAEEAIGLYTDNDTQDKYFVTAAELVETYGNALGFELFEILSTHAA